MSEWLPFLATKEDNEPAAMKVCFVMSSTQASNKLNTILQRSLAPEDDKRGIKQEKAVSEPLDSQDQNDRTSENAVINPPSSALSLTSNISAHSNKNSDKETGTKTSRNQRTRAIRRPVPISLSCQSSDYFIETSWE